VIKDGPFGQPEDVRGRNIDCRGGKNATSHSAPRREEISSTVGGKKVRVGGISCISYHDGPVPVENALLKMNVIRSS